MYDAEWRNLVLAFLPALLRSPYNAKLFVMTSGISVLLFHMTRVHQMDVAEIEAAKSPKRVSSGVSQSALCANLAIESLQVCFRFST